MLRIRIMYALSVVPFWRETLIFETLKNKQHFSDMSYTRDIINQLKTIRRKAPF